MVSGSSVNYAFGALRKLGKYANKNTNNSRALARAAAALHLQRDEIATSIPTHREDVELQH